MRCEQCGVTLLRCCCESGPTNALLEDDDEGFVDIDEGGEFEMPERLWSSSDSFLKLSPKTI